MKIPMKISKFSLYRKQKKGSRMLQFSLFIRKGQGMVFVCEWSEEMRKKSKTHARPEKDILVLLRREFYCFGAGEYIRLKIISSDWLSQ